MVYLTVLYLKNFMEMWRAIPARRLVWSMEKRLEWSMESLSRRNPPRQGR